MAALPLGKPTCARLSGCRGFQQPDGKQSFFTKYGVAALVADLSGRMCINVRRTFPPSSVGALHPR